MPNISFRKCNIQDLKVLRSISIETFTNTYAHLNTKENFEKHLESAFNENQLTQELQNPETVFYFLENENQVIGYLKLNEGDAQSEKMKNHCYEVERIYLKKAFHGKGYGRLLLEKAIEVAIEKGKNEVWLGVWEKNPNAIGFYKKMGFEVFGTHVFKVGDEEQTDFLLRRLTFDGRFA